MKGDGVEIVVAGDDGSRTYEIVATRAGRRVEVTTGRGVAEVVEVTRTGEPVRTARFMASRVVALVEHPASEISAAPPRSESTARWDGFLARSRVSPLNLAGPTRRFRVWPTSSTLEQRVVIHSSPKDSSAATRRECECDRPATIAHPNVADAPAGRQMSTTLSSGHDGSRRSRQPPLRVLNPKVRVHARMPGNGQAAVLRAAQRGTGSEVQRRALVSSLRPSSTTQRVCP